MSKKQFKTSIKCAGCIENVSPFLNEQLTPEEWSVDITSPSKILTVESDKVSAEEIQNLVKKAGYEIELLAE